MLDARGQPLGTALWSASSQIALRLVSTRILDDRAWATLFRERLRHAIQLRTRMQAAEIELTEAGLTDAGRLVFSEADFLPGLIADRYSDLVVVQLLTQAMNAPGIRSALLEILSQEIAPRAVYLRTDARIRDLEELGPAEEAPLYLSDHPATRPSATVFHLNGLAFEYNANSGQKTGAFLDQRQNYLAAASYCRGEALDVCTYQGGFALHLARTCSRVSGVDLSRPALEVAERNLERNRHALGGRRRGVDRGQCV